MLKGSPLTLRNHFIKPYRALDTLLSSIVNSWLSADAFNSQLNYFDLPLTNLFSRKNFSLLSNVHSAQVNVTLMEHIKLVMIIDVATCTQ